MCVYICFFNRVSGCFRLSPNLPKLFQSHPLGILGGSLDRQDLKLDPKESWTHLKNRKKCTHLFLHHVNLNTRKLLTIKRSKHTDHICLEKYPIVTSGQIVPISTSWGSYNPIRMLFFTLFTRRCLQKNLLL